MRKSSAAATFIIIGFTLMLGFHNCSQVDLKRPGVEEKLFSVAGKIDLCLAGTYENYTLENGIVSNLNLINVGDSVYVDTDGDGVADDQELNFGFDPQKRRSNAKLLDGICLNLSGSKDCTAAIPRCVGLPNLGGLTDCDYRALGLDLLGIQRDEGIDSDKDGIPDVLEILRGTLPAEADALLDPDHDLTTNLQEISQGSNTRVAEANLNPKFSVKATFSRSEISSTACQGETWVLDIEKFPWFKAEPFQDELEEILPPGGLSFSHSEDTNIAAIFLILKPKAGFVGNKKVLLRQINVGPEMFQFSGTIQEFNLIGETPP